VITDLLLPLGLAFIMFAMGLALVPGDFARVITRPKAMAAGLVARILLLPATAALLILLFEPAPEVAVGLMILAACPGGVTSNFLSYLARGDAALSISLTAVSSLAGALTLPLTVNIALQVFAASEAIEISIARMTIGVLAGMALRHFSPCWAKRLETGARRLSVAVFALIVIGAFASQWGDMARLFAAAGPLAMALNLATVTLGFALAAGLRLNRAQRTAITMECGLQNAGVTIFVAATIMGRPELMIPALIYALWMNVTAVGVIGWELARTQRPAHTH